MMARTKELPALVTGETHSVSSLVRRFTLICQHIPNSLVALLGMTLTIQLFVYPDAYPTHGTWAAVLLYLMMQGPGKLSLDHWIAQRYR